MVTRVLAGRYELVRFVGRGGMGEVWEARDRVIARRVAVKLLAHDLRDASGAALFFREARVAGGLSHPGVVTVHDLGQDPDEGTLFLVMELLTGRDLATVLSEDGPPPVATAVDWAARTASALAAAHDAGVVHRDLKPANLILTTSGSVKVLDFGIARYVESTHRSSKVMGTLAYMPPERFDEHPGDARSDLYSLGCVLHELLTGKTPFDATGPLSIMNAHLRRPPQPPGAVRPGVPAELDDLVLALLAKEPARRPASALAVAEWLARLAEHGPSGDGGTSPPSSGASPSSTSPRQDATEFSDPTPSAPAAPTWIDQRDHGLTSQASTVTSPRGVSGPGRLAYRLRRTLTSEVVRQVSAVAFSPDGRTIATGDADGDIRFWDPHTGEQLHRMTGTEYVHALVFSPDGSKLASGAQDKVVRLWDPRTGTLRSQLTGHTAAVVSLAFSPDGHTLVTGTYIECLLWDMHAGKAVRGHSDMNGPVAFSPDGESLAAWDAKGGISLWDPRSGKRRRRQRFTVNTPGAWFHQMAFSPDGRTLAAAGTVGEQHVIHVWAGHKQRQLTGHTDYIVSMAFSPDGGVLAAGDKSGAIIIRDARTGEQLLVLARNVVSIAAVAFNPDGDTLAASDQNGNVHLWATRG